MAKRCAAFVVLCVVALALHAAAAARTVPGGAVTASLPAAKNGGATGAGAGVADKKNLFVGVGGMGDLPGFPAVGAGYGGGFGNNGGGVFSGVTGPLGGVGGGIGGAGPLGGAGGFGPLGGGGTPFGGFGGTPFGGFGGGAGGIGGGGAGGVTP
ncbi:glycine-rich protein 23-like [Phragmites australis]|uniref:glycine-rich protein 23-like n=1 Tax=Phragmites australis TaxID=29695 RepID=UPI002D76FC7A|nr:glycine-rich protein 23-like [Phragmites australis]